MALGAYLDCAREQGVTLLQAHRAGDRPGAAENSIRAINASLADGAVLIEMDVRRTADGVLVLMHDRTVERTTTGAGTVTEMSYSEFSALDLRDVDGARVDENPPTLAAALAVLAGRGVAQLDLKTIEIDTIAAAVEAAGAVDRSVIITLTLDDAIALHQRLPGVMISTPISALADLETLDAAGVDRTRLSAWLGVGPGNPELDAVLAAEGIETSYGDFRAERAGGADYAALAANGAEILSVDDVPAAARTLNAAEASRTLLTTCQAARD
jgi:glycerophosphoryl diester phosphodiesterase